VAERSFARDELVLSHIADAVISLDRDHVIQSWNAGAERIYGFSATEAVGRPISMLFLEEEIDHVLPPALEALKQAGFHRFEARNRHRSGEIRHSLISMALVGEAGGEMSGALAYVIDVTEQKQNEQLAALGLFTTQMAHSIKNIQTHLMGSLRMVDLGLEQGDMDKVHQMWPLMRTSTMRISRVVSDMLGLARHSAVLADPFIFPALVTSLVDSCSHFGRLRGVRILVESDPRIQWICQDEGRIYDSLLNLLLNAIEAHDYAAETDKMVRLRAELAEQGRRLNLVVEDNGPGIDPDMVDRIFDPFFTTKGKHGTGLGLAVVQKQIREMGGEITVDSAVGEGTRFLVSLPLG